MDFFSRTKNNYKFGLKLVCLTNMRFKTCKFLSILFLSMLIVSQIQGQNVLSFQLTEEVSLPPTFLQEKAAVFILDIDNEREWKKYATKMHRHLQRAGVDVVAYYNANDVFANYQIRQNFFEEITMRQITNLIIFDAAAGYKISGMAMPTDPNELLNGYPAKSVFNTDLEEVGNDFFKMIFSQGLKKTNFLIIDQPDYIELVPLVTGKRFESYNPDVKIDKLAVSKFDRNFPEQSAEEANEVLKEIMESYPFRFEWVESQIEDESALVRTRGTQFVMYVAYGHGSSLKRLLGYKVDSAETMYISLRRGEKGSVKQWKANDLVYKFYMKHVYSGDFYMGSQWDADSNWEQALINFIENLKTDLKVK